MSSFPVSVRLLASEQAYIVFLRGLRPITWLTLSAQPWCPVRTLYYNDQCACYAGLASCLPTAGSRQTAPCGLLPASTQARTAAWDTVRLYLAGHTPGSPRAAAQLCTWSFGVKLEEHHSALVLVLLDCKGGCTTCSTDCCRAHGPCAAKVLNNECVFLTGPG
jgi:hypothetical protein